MKAEKPSDGRVKTTLYLPETLHRQAKVYAARHGTTMTDLVVDGLRKQLKERPEEAGQ
jgi:plasmid stability protein